MLKLFPLRRSFSLDLAPDDSNSNFLLHVNDDSELVGHTNIVGTHLLPPQLPSKSIHHTSSAIAIAPNMSAAVQWHVDDIDDALAADFDGSLSGLGIELGTASFNMSEALMALPNLSSLKHHDSSGHGSNHGTAAATVPPHHHHHHHSSNFLLASSLHSSIATLRTSHESANTSNLDRSVDSPQHVVASAEEKPVAVVHGKKNRLAYGNDDDSVNPTSIKRFCLSSEREASNLRILLTDNLATTAIEDEPHQCGDDCFNGVQCHLRHSSSVPDLRSNLTNNSFSPNLQVSHSAATSPSLSSTSNPSGTFFSQIISSQIHGNNGGGNNGGSGGGGGGGNLSMNNNSLGHEMQSSRNNKNESSKFQYVLGASTSMAIKMHEETMTYLNQGQSYEIKLKKVGDLSEMKGKMLQTIIRVCFYDRRLQYMEKELIEQWKEQRPSERVLEIDVPLSYGIHDVRNDHSGINKSEFHWDPTKETGVFIRINCISTEFTQKKHGGEKGVPFRIVIETYSKDSLEPPSHCLHAASCQVKVFKPKGADRKHKTDREKMNKKSATEQEKYQPSYDCTVFTDCSLDTFALYNLSSNQSVPANIFYANDSNEPNPAIVSSSSGTSVATATTITTVASATKMAIQPIRSKSPLKVTSNPIIEKSNSLYHLFSDISNNSFDLNFANFTSASIQSKPLSLTANSEDTQKWLKENRFEAYLATFTNFSGSDLLLLSKDDLIQICGLTDGIRLYNALHSKNVKSKLSIYIRNASEEIFHAIYLANLTANELQSKIIANLLKSRCTYLKRLCVLGPSGVKILMTDEVVANMQDESLYVIDFSKDYSGEYNALMKPYKLN